MDPVATDAAMRRLWSDHVIWTRQYVVAAVGTTPMPTQPPTRLLKNQDDIGNAVVPSTAKTPARA